MSDMARVDCGNCHACCRGEMVALTEGEHPADYDCDEYDTPAGRLAVLKHKPNGDCIYLGDAGCTIHGRHPRMCRVFDCAAFARLWPRARRRASGMGMTDVLREGQRRLRAAARQPAAAAP